MTARSGSQRFFLGAEIRDGRLDPRTGKHTMIRIKLHDGDTIDTHLHTRDQVLAAQTADADITVGGDDDTWYGPEDLLGDDDTFDVRGTKPRRTIPAAQIAAVEEVGA